MTECSECGGEMIKTGYNYCPGCKGEKFYPDTSTLTEDGGINGNTLVKCANEDCGKVSFAQALPLRSILN